MLGIFFDSLKFVEIDPQRFEINVLVIAPEELVQGCTSRLTIVTNFSIFGRAKQYTRVNNHLQAPPTLGKMPPPLSNRKSRAKASNAEDDELERRAAEIEAAEQAAETEQDEARTREEYLARAKLDKRDSNGIMDLSFWIWEGNKITTIVDDNAIRTRDLLDKLRRSRYNDVRTIIENDNVGTTLYNYYKMFTSSL